MASNNTILLKGDFGRRYNEKKAGSTITPGMILEDTDAETWDPHSVSGGIWNRTVAVENSLQGIDGVSTQGNTIDDDYPVDTLVRGIEVESGDIINALLADGQNIAYGVSLMSNGAGALTAWTATNHVACWAEEAVDNSAGGAVARIAVKIR